jgi:hypothetical protein
MVPPFSSRPGGARLRARWAALLLPAALFAAGCSDDETFSTHETPNVVAVTAPDSIPAGQPIDIKVHWRSRSTCESFEGASVQVVNDTTISLVISVVETVTPDAPCDPRDVVLEGLVRIADPPATRFRVEVYGAAERFVLPVVGGAAPAAIERHAVTILNSVGGTGSGAPPVPGATAAMIPEGADTLFTLVADADGKAEQGIACAGDRRYQLDVTGASNRRVVLDFFSNPARCAIPERTIVRL